MAVCQPGDVHHSEEQEYQLLQGQQRMFLLKETVGHRRLLGNWKPVRLHFVNVEIGTLLGSQTVRRNIWEPSSIEVGEWRVVFLGFWAYVLIKIVLNGRFLV